MPQKLRQENFRKNVVNTVKFYRLKRQLRDVSVRRPCVMLVNTDSIECTLSALQCKLRSLAVKGRTQGD